MPMRVPQIGRTVPGTAAFDAFGIDPMQDHSGKQTQQLGQAVQAAGEGVSAIAEETQRQVDTAELLRQDNQIAERVRTTLQGYGNLLGKDAVDAHQQVIDELADYQREVEGAMPQSEQLRKNLSAAINRRMLSARASIDQHYQAQAKANMFGETKAAMESRRLDAIRLAGTPEFATFRASMLERADELADMQGWAQDSEQRRRLREEQTTSLHEHVIDDMLTSGRTDQARQWLEHFQGDVSPDRRAKLQGAVGRSAIADQSTRLALTIPGDMVTEARAQRGAMNQDDPIPDPRTSPTYLIDATAKLDAMFAAGAISAEVRDATIDRVRADAADFRQLYARETEAVMGTAEKWLAEHPNEPVGAMPPKIYVELEQRGQLGALRSFAQNRRYVTDPKALAAFDALPDAQLQTIDRAELRTQLRGLLDDTDLNYALARHAKANSVADDKQLRILSVNDRISEFLRKVGVLPRSGFGADEARSEEAYKMRTEIQNRLRVFEQTQLGGKRAANDEELQRILDDAVLDKVLVDVLGPDSTVPNIRLTADQQKAAYVVVAGEVVPVSKVPDAQRKQIVAALQRRGLPVSEQAVVEMWVEGGRKQ